MNSQMELYILLLFFELWCTRITCLVRDGPLVINSFLSKQASIEHLHRRIAFEFYFDSYTVTCWGEGDIVAREKVRVLFFWIMSDLKGLNLFVTI